MSRAILPLPQAPPWRAAGGLLFHPQPVLIMQYGKGLTIVYINKYINKFFTGTEKNQGQISVRNYGTE
jgi:hypothetical protein